MNNIKRNQLEELEDVSLYFETIINNNRYPLFWSEILDVFQGVNYWHTVYYGQLPQRFYAPKDFSCLEKMGIDYNHLDAGGNNFLQFAISEKSRPTKSDEKGNKFFDPAIEYILSKTMNIYNTNRANEHILFDMLGFVIANYDGSDLFKFIKKYPDFNLKQFNNSGQNLLNIAMLRNAPEKVVDFLLLSQISINHLDCNESSLLNYFTFLNYMPNNIKLFDHLILANDLNHQDKWKETCITFWSKQIMNKELNDSSKKQSKQWLNHTFKKISQGEFLYNNDSLQKLIETLQKIENPYLKFISKNENKDEYESLHLYFTKALKGLLYLKLQKTVSNHDNASQKTKNKI